MATTLLEVAYGYEKRDGVRTGRVSTLEIVAWLMTIVMILMVCLRMFAKFTTRRAMSVDDILALAAMVTGTGGTIAITAATNAGLAESVHDALAVERILKSVYANTILYFFTIWLAKLSTLALMYRLCSSLKVIRGLVGFVLAWGITAVLSTALQCLPRPWDTAGRCVNLNALGNSMGVLDMLTDAILVVLPLWMFGALQMPFVSRLMVIMAFSCRFVVIIVAICRLVYLNLALNKRTSTSLQMSYFICTELQQSLSVIVASVPSIRLFLDRTSTRADGPSPGNDMPHEMDAQSESRQPKHDWSPQTTLHGYATPDISQSPRTSADIGDRVVGGHVDPSFKHDGKSTLPSTPTDDFSWVSIH